MARGAVGEEVKLRFDPVLHVAAGAIEILVKSPRLAREIGDDITRVGAETIVLDLRDDRRSAAQVLAA